MAGIRNTVKAILTDPYDAHTSYGTGNPLPVSGQTTNAAELFGQYEATLVDGAEIATDWLDMVAVDKYIIRARSNAVGLDLMIESRSDPAQAVLTTTTTYDAGTFFLSNLISRERYMRFHWQNNTGNTVNEASLSIQATYGSSDKLSVFPVSVQPSIFSQASLVQSIIRGQDSAGTFQSVRVNSAGSLVTASPDIEIIRGNISNISHYNKFGSSVVVNASGENTPPQDIWSGGGLYTGQNPTSGATISIASLSPNDTGTLQISGTATGGSSTAVIDSGADFVSASVLAGDLLINDTQSRHAVITAVTTTTLTFFRLAGNDNAETTDSVASGDAYRVVKANSTGASVLRVQRLLTTAYTGYSSEYVILSGETPVKTVGTDYIRTTRATVIHAGDSASNEGIITGTHTGTGDICWSMPIGANDTQICGDTVPANKWLYLRNIQCQFGRTSSSIGSAEVEFLTRNVGEVYSLMLNAQITNSQGYRTSPDYVLALPPYTDWIYRVKNVSLDGSQFYAEVSGIMVDVS